ncbi:hypothetical protein SUDANB6_02813 [Streptomyces sp. enrichment culture]|uniref:hypothetical protein n=1 Tax=Streptomyces sp. enrichment culture TaxID=1795815 RepID=UPI003F5622E3
MLKPIRHALEQAFALVLALLFPATGRRRLHHRHRRPGHPAPAPLSPRTLSGLRLFIRRSAPPGLLAALPPRRWKDTPAALDDTGPLVRPYLLAHERRQRQLERRAALVLAVEGIDVGPWVIHGHYIGTPAEVAA